MTSQLSFETAFRNMPIQACTRVNNINEKLSNANDKHGAVIATEELEGLAEIVVGNNSIPNKPFYDAAENILKGQDPQMANLVTIIQTGIMEQISMEINSLAELNSGFNSLNNKTVFSARTENNKLHLEQTCGFRVFQLNLNTLPEGLATAMFNFLLLLHYKTDITMIDFEACYTHANEELEQMEVVNYDLAVEVLGILDSTTHETICDLYAVLSESEIHKIEIFTNVITEFEGFDGEIDIAKEFLQKYLTSQEIQNFSDFYGNSYLLDPHNLLWYVQSLPKNIHANFPEHIMWLEKSCIMLLNSNPHDINSRIASYSFELLSDLKFCLFEPKYANDIYIHYLNELINCDEFSATEIAWDGSDEQTTFFATIPYIATVFNMPKTIRTELHAHF